jgi:hypothetical protein
MFIKYVNPISPAGLWLKTCVVIFDGAFFCAKEQLTENPEIRLDAFERKICAHFSSKCGV